MFKSVILFFTIVTIASICAINRATSNDLYSIDDMLYVAQDIDNFVPDTALKVDMLANAIYKAENSKKYPYGIKSIDTKGNEVYARKICENTIRNQVKRWEKHRQEGASYSYLDSLAARYCPVGAENDPDNLNVNWISNVKWFLERS